MNDIEVKTIDDYINQFQGHVKERLLMMRQIIRENAPLASEKISYKMPTFYLQGNLVHFAAAKNHIGFYPTPSAIEAFNEDLKAYKTSKGAVQFPYDQPLPFKLIGQMVAYRVKENEKGPKSK